MSNEVGALLEAGHRLDTMLLKEAVLAFMGAREVKRRPRRKGKRRG